MQSVSFFDSYSALASKTDQGSPEYEKMVKLKSGSQFTSLHCYEVFTLLLITRSSTSSSARHVVVLFESFTIAVSLHEKADIC